LQKYWARHYETSAYPVKETICGNFIIGIGVRKAKSHIQSSKEVCMKRVIFVPFLLILLSAFFAFGQAEAEYKVVKVTKESGEESDQGFLGVYLGELTPEVA
jgi:hypothetical protein